MSTTEILNLIESESGCDDILNMNPKEVINNIVYARVPEDDIWRIDFPKELLILRQGNLELDENIFTSDEIKELIEFVATD